MEPFITIQDLSYTLPNGRVLFENISGSFGGELSALTGRNGSGKTVLAKIMAGLIPPCSGRVLCSGIVRYVDQIVDPSNFATVADLAGKEDVLRALHRVMQGRSEEGDYELVEGNWDFEERFLRELKVSGLGHLSPCLPASRLSGGECTRVSLVGAFLSGADFLILDEPTNHLDALNRDALIEYLGTWKGGLLVISHDRSLLRKAGRIFELSSGRLKSYGGNLEVFMDARKRQHDAAVEDLDRIRTERKRAEKEHRISLEKQQKRISRGRKTAPGRGISKMMLTAMKDSAEKTEGKIRSTSGEKSEVLAAAEKEAFLNAGIEDPVVLIPPQCSVHPGKVIFRLAGVVLPFGSHGKAIDLTAIGSERVAVTGSNGSGKTTLLRILRKEIEPLSGSCDMMVPFASLDQFASIPTEISPIEHLCASSPEMPQGEAGTRLAQVGISRERLWVRNGKLSGGERLKVALLSVIHGVPAPQLLILDEPTNHLDLDSVESVEKLLIAYTGAMVVVSHDRWFLENIGITREIELENRLEGSDLHGLLPK